MARTAGANAPGRRTVSARPIVLLTDFGASDWYVAAMKGVLLGRAPEATLVDLTHAIPPGDVRRAAFALENAWVWFPGGSVFLVVVDPGVGTERRPLAISTSERFFVGPDNGVLEPALAEPDAAVRAIEPVRVEAGALSRTFHGRDLFAPAAAHLAAEGDFDAIGEPVPDPVRLPPVRPVREGDALVAHVVWVDRFGNCITDCRESDLREFRGRAAAERLEVEAGPATIRGLLGTYGEREPGAACALIGSSGRLEIAVAGGHAASRFGLGPGDPVRLRLGPANDPA